MFSESLLDSSTRVRKVRHWPMATAFTLEAAAAAVAIVLSLLTTNVLPARARDIITTPLRSAPLAERNSNNSTRNTTHSPGTMVVQVLQRPNALAFRRPGTNQSEPAALPAGDVGGPDGIPAGLMERNYVPPQPPAPERPGRISVLSEAQLLKKVEPIYPHIATVAGISGTVKLHAIIGKDGAIEDLNVVEGHPLLAEAALEAVRQWLTNPMCSMGAPLKLRRSLRSCSASRGSDS